MPKDDWAKANRRDRGNAADRSGECFRKGDWAKDVAKARKKDKQKRRRKGRRHVPVTIDPPKPPRCMCGSKDVLRASRAFRDGQVHICVTCSKCGSFIKWENAH